MTKPNNRWSELTGGQSGQRYAERFAELARTGVDVHGEARFCGALLDPGSRVLDAGCGTGRVAVWLADNGHRCVGVDSDASMLAEARRSPADVSWIQADLCDVATLGLEPDFDMVVVAGNVIPLLAAGTGARVVAALASLLRPGGLQVAGFGLDAEHLPLSSAPVGLADYDAWCAAAGLSLVQRCATWQGEPYAGGGYAVSVHERGAPLA
ncbi:SAM-dependent methyltransferase [Lipingzhangella halophila]|uniref:SAM-dependent methyltransferase n=1 Tax=Lipingzhangella halophila TaxID=1783352 RepID=A0A7W7RGW6_9ACTN|nr:class I SAM-dependent methyltransferase [Lipingzhangella halophila]MBB4931657.1 SAM-dependent methyltransferase [Lipingzhangella halophila]